MATQKFVSQKGKDKLTHCGYSYIFAYEFKNGAIRWECDKRKTLKCRGHVITTEGNAGETREHNHAANPTTVQASVVMGNVRKRAMETMEKPILLTANATRDVPDSVVPALPSHRNMGRTISRIRRKDTPTLPVSLIDLEIPNRYQTTFSGSRFLLFDSGSSLQRVMIFTTERNLDLMTENHNWFMDGTFKTSPGIFEQIYTVHCCYREKVIPMVYALLPNKSQETYSVLFNRIRDLKPDMHPETILLDFEHAALNVLREVFPGSRIRGCFFHFQQSLWRKIQRTPDLNERYLADPDFAVKLRRISALAFRREADVRPTYAALLENGFDLDQPVLEFLEYFERTWIGQPPHGNRAFWTDPVFPVGLWNVYEAVTGGLARTNNGVEGWHSRFQTLVGEAHPNVYRLIECLQKEEDVTRQVCVAIRAGAPPRRPNLKYQNLNERLQRVVAEYDNVNPVEYLQAIAHNLAFHGV